MNILSCMKNSIFIGLVMLLFTSCGYYDDMITTWYYTSDEIEKWLVDSTQFQVTMQDQNGIAREFKNWNNVHTFTSGAGYFAGIKTHKSQNEYYHQQFRSSYFDEFTVSVYPKLNEVLGDQLDFGINSTMFKYDFIHEEIVSIDVNNHHEALRINSEGIENDTLFSSTFEIIENYAMNGTNYGTSFHFTLNDFSYLWDEFTITEVYFAQGTGLLQYKMKNGLVFKRN